MKRARGVLVFVLVIVLLLSIPGATVFAQETVNDLGPVSSKDVIYQIITDRFYDGDSTNNIPVGFSSNLYDGTGADLKLYQGGDWDGIVQKIPYLKGMGVTAVWISAPYENRDTAIIDYQNDGVTTLGPAFMDIMCVIILQQTSILVLLMSSRICGMLFMKTALNW